VLAWKTRNGVYLLADSAITNRGIVSLPFSNTSFGEKVIAATTGTVSEGGLKIVRVGRMAIAFAGSALYGYNIASTVKTLLAFGASPADSLRHVVENRLDRPANLRLVATFVGADGPVLLAFNEDGLAQWEDVKVGNMVQLGNAPGWLMELSLRFLGLFAKSQLPPRDYLALSLAWAQGYGIRHALMQFGIGGPCLGLVCHSTGLDWHADTLFVLYDQHAGTGDWVASVVRENAHVVISSVSKRQSVFSAEGFGPDVTGEWANGAAESIYEGKFTYVCILSTTLHTMAVVVMNSELRHQDLRLGIFRRQGEFRIEVALSAALIHELKTPLEEKGPRWLPIKVIWRPNAPTDLSIPDPQWSWLKAARVAEGHCDIQKS